MTDDTFVSWLAVGEDKIIETSGMSFIEKSPYLAALVDSWGCFQVCFHLRIIADGVLHGFRDDKLRKR